jgi:hypothetical protein
LSEFRCARVHRNSLVAGNLLNDRGNARIMGGGLGLAGCGFGIASGSGAGPETLGVSPARRSDHAGCDHAAGDHGGCHHGGREHAAGGCDRTAGAWIGGKLRGSGRAPRLARRPACPRNPAETRSTGMPARSSPSRPASRRRSGGNRPGHRGRLRRVHNGVLSSCRQLFLSSVSAYRLGY